MDDHSVWIEKTFRAGLRKVWDAWTDPAVIVKWFGSDPNGVVLHAELDVRPGGRFEVSFQDADQTLHTCSGTYMEVAPLHLLVFSWHWKSEPGVASNVRVLFAQEGESTRMQFAHMHLGIGSQHNYTEGWLSTFSKLERVLQTGL